jgi:RHS repeat-associated protein
VFWAKATTNATIGVVGTYSDPDYRQLDAGATYLSGTGLEAWCPVFPPTMAAWHFGVQPFAFSLSYWQSRLNGDLVSMDNLPRTFPPGAALYVIVDAPTELEIPDPALRIRYYHQDHLGSSSVMTDADGALVEETAFYPFGEARNSYELRQIEESYKFTQKERDRESGLHYFEARYLPGKLSRFLSVDPKYANIESPAGDAQRLNVYSYVRNNPLQYTDPTGLQPAPGQPDLSQIADAVAVQATKEAREDEGTLMQIGRVASTITVGVCDNAFGCGLGGYQVTRQIVSEGYNVDTDSKLYKGSAVVGLGLSLAVPVPPILGFLKTGGTAGKLATAAEEGGAVAKTLVKGDSAVASTVAKPVAGSTVTAATVSKTEYFRAAGDYANKLRAARAGEVDALLKAGKDARGVLSEIGAEVEKRFPGAGFAPRVTPK